MFAYTELLVSPTISVKKAIKIIHATGKKCVFVASESNELLGLFTDGDMRRFLLSGGSLNEEIVKAMNPSPSVIHSSVALDREAFNPQDQLIVYPVVNEENVLIDAIFWDEMPTQGQTKKKMLAEPITNVSTVVMAGGLGRRLYPYTKVLPKALIPIGDLPICSHVINSFKDYGCNDFHLILNHKKNIVKAFYNDIEKDYSMTYHEEVEFLGTAGGLTLLKDKIKTTFFLSNCDILVDVDYSCVYEYHKKHNNFITFIAATKDVEIPYGVIKMDEGGKIMMEEKPTFSFLTNVGIYLLEPEVIDGINENESIGMPDLITRFIEQGKKVEIFPVSGDAWLDMGQIEEMKNMQNVLEQRVQSKVK